MNTPLRTRLAISAGKLAATASRLAGRGEGMIIGGTVALKLSPHALEDLAQGRVAALAFDVAVLTNLSRDHLDYHGSMQAYAEAKAALFAWSGLRCRVLNLDDAFGRQLAAQDSEARLITYSLEDSSAYLYCREAQFNDEGVRATLVTPQGEHLLRSTLGIGHGQPARLGQATCLTPPHS